MRSKATLRQQAEDLLKKKSLENPHPLSEADSLKLINELEVHQIELEMQNEELLLAKQQAEEAIEKYTNLYDFAPTGYFTLSNTNEIIVLNLTGAKMLGKDRSKLIKSRFGFFVSDETKPVFNAFLDRTFTNNGIETCEVVLLADDNRSTYVHLSGTINGKGEQCLLTVTDFTERKKADIQLAFQSSLLEQVHNGVIVIDFNNTILYWNKFAEHLYQWNSSEAIGENIIALLSPEEMKETMQSNFKNLNQDGHWEGDFNVRRKDGTTISVHIINSYITDENGNKVGFAGISTDITDRRRIEGTLRETNAYLENLINCANAPIIVWDAHFRITRFNHAFEHITGRTEAEVIGHSLELLFPPNLASETMAQIHKTLTGERWETVEIEILHRDNSIRTVLWNSATIFETDGKTPIATIAQGQDITQRKKAEQEIKLKNEELSELNAQKDRFFSIIAHDLKSPFNSIMGFSEILVGQINENDYDGIKRYAEIILVSSQRAMDLLMNLMDWTRAQTGRMEFNPEYFEMVDLIDENILLFDDIAAQKGVTINRILSPNIPVFADKEMLNTVCRNLISNAIKFTKPDGEIVISAIEKQTEIMVSVSDNGVGISKTNIEKLFRIDQKYTTSGTNREQGTGLGLLLCKEFIEKHGGHIRVESLEGIGSTFSFTLPLNAIT
jgi:PAS domain S-box-containing protein